MILLHRITPFALSAFSLAGFALLIVRNPDWRLPAIFCFIMVPLLFARLTLWEIRRPAFWVFVGTPTLLLGSSIIFYLFLENIPAMWVLAATVSVALFLYGENIFTFYHFPRNYQAYALEHLSLVLDIASAFFFTSGAYAAQLFLRLPLWMPAIAVFVAILLAIIAVFWVSKIGFETGFAFAVVGAVLLTEVYIALATLPTSFVTNAGAFAVCFYLYLSLARAHVLSSLTTTVVKRLSLTSLVLLLCIFGTARWI